MSQNKILNHLRAIESQPSLVCLSFAVANEDCAPLALGAFMRKEEVIAVVRRTDCDLILLLLLLLLMGKMKRNRRRWRCSGASALILKVAGSGFNAAQLASNCFMLVIAVVG